ncbi:MAG: hypothetical protein P4M01_04000 [Acidobacteriota bacterium]|nr:hypothetical protein [Acidobacteriota bacterium]
MSRYSAKLQSNPSGVPTALEPVQKAYNGLRGTQRSLLLVIVFCAAFGFTMGRGAGSLGSRTYLPVIFATTLLTFAYTLRNSSVLPSLGELRRNPHNDVALARWRRNSVIVMSLCAAVALLGLALQLFGAALPIVVAVYAIAAVYLFLLGPIRP